jgi:hypothetical protein
MLAPNKALPFIKQAAEGASSAGLHKPVGLVLASAYVLGTACQLSGAAALMFLPGAPFTQGIASSMHALL